MTQPANPAGLRNPHFVRTALTIGTVSMLLIALVLLYLLTQATKNQGVLEHNYQPLFLLNTVVATALLAGIAWVGYRLLIRLRQGRFGSRLLLKIASIFALVGVAPGVLIYGVSYQFVSRSIETWFDVKVEGALDAGIQLGRVTLDSLSSDFAGKVRAAALDLSDVSAPAGLLSVQRLLDQWDATDVSIWTTSGRLLSTASVADIRLAPEPPISRYIKLAQVQGAYVWIEGLEEAGVAAPGGVQVKVLVPLLSSSFGLNVEERYLYASKLLPATLIANALAVEQAYREYQERALASAGLKRMYIGTLTLSLFLAVFGAVLLAVILGDQIARPLLLLTEGVSQVAAGDLTPKLVLQGKDELGGLTRAFASMTEQLAEARQSVEHSMAQLDAARGNLQTILDNLTSGVVVLSLGGEVKSCNPGATRILKVPLAAHVGKPLSSIAGLEGFGAAVQAQFVEFDAHSQEHGLDHWQQSFELQDQSAAGLGPYDRSITLVARGAALPGSARLLVFDDISEIVSAQRAQAWGEVARRVAHEIKNPLTPIQLSAERMERRLLSKLDTADQAILIKSVKTIVDQVDAMKRLVNEFRDYARLPTADLKSLDLNALILDVIQLYETDFSKERIILQLDPTQPRVLADAQQLRQVIHNLLQNAQDANDAVGQIDSSTVRQVTLRTRCKAGSDRVQLIVSDQGGGFPAHILQRAFEPYVTTKTKGTGLGLAIVKKIADEHGARIDIRNLQDAGRVGGAQVSLSLVLEKSTST
jgi:nitrogen fixation/metabolism regulation signal transduction histidine kinase